MPEEGNYHGARGALGLNRTFPHIFKIELEEVGIPAILTAHREMVASNSQIVGSGDTTISAGSRFCGKLPQVIAANAGIEPLCTYIQGSGNKDPGSTTVIADHLRLRPDRFNNLVRVFTAVVAGRTVSGEDEPFTHTGYYSSDFL